MPTACVMLRFSEQVAERLVQPDGEPAEKLHSTVAYLGEVNAEKAQELLELIRVVAEDCPPLRARVGGVGRFQNEDEDVLVGLVDSVDIEEFRAALLEVLGAVGIEQASEHGFTPHVTLRYLAPDEQVELPELPLDEFEFTAIRLNIGENDFDFPIQEGSVEELDSSDLEKGHTYRYVEGKLWETS